MKASPPTNYSCDTSVLISQRVGDRHQASAHSLIEKAGVPISISRLNQLEFTTVVSRLKGDKKVGPKRAEEILAEFEEHLQSGVLQLVKVDEASVWNQAISLARKHSASLLVRSLDVWQVAFALEMAVTEFWTFDDRQKQLAAEVGLRVNP